MLVYERDSVYRQRMAVGEQIPVVAGRNGMGWAKGLHGEHGEGRET